MSSSDEIKDRIVRQFKHTKVPNGSKDWKRLRKFAIAGETLREFHNPVLSRTVFTVGDDEDAQIYELDQWVYGIFRDEDGGLTVAFEPEDRFNRSGFVYDQHQGHLLSVLHNLPDLFDEVQENMFMVDDPSMTELKLYVLLAKYGFKHSQALSDFLANPGKPAALGTVGAPVNPPMPPALDPSWVAPVINLPSAAHSPAPPIASVSGGFYGTGLEEDGSAVPSDFLFTVYVESGRVSVAITAKAAFETDAGFDQHISSLLDHLIPSDWDEASEQTFEPGSLTGRQAYDLLEAAGFQRSDSHDEWYEKEPSFHVVKAASASPAGAVTSPVSASDFLFTMVDQLDGWAHVAICSYQRWEDDGELEETPVLPIVAHLIPSDWSEVSDGLFKCGDLAMAPAFAILHTAGFILEEDFEECVSEEYDSASVGWGGLHGGPPPVTPTPAPRPAPRVGPAAGKITGSSFSPLPDPEPEVEEPEAVMPERHLDSDAGDEKVQFRKELWDAWKGRDPAETQIRFHWYDRYRDRKAVVTGLGFAFHLKEFTGIKLRMGYLDEDGKFNEGLTLPASMIEELFKDYEGEFEGGEIQFIYKKPDTSADELWEELEPLLVAQGWTKLD